MSIFVVGLLAISSCARGDGQKLIITGSSTIAPMLGDAARAFEAKHPKIRIDVQTGGSSRGIADVRKGVADIGMVSRAPKNEENDLVAHAIARDGVSIIVHKDNKLNAVDKNLVRAIYLGQITDWNEVKGSGLSGPITVVNKAEGRSTLEVFLKYFKLKNSEIKSQVVIGDNEQGIKTVSGNPSGIGYVAIGTAETNIAAGAPIRLLSIDGVGATTQNVRNQSFPISRQLTLVTKTQPEGIAKTFIDYIKSDALLPHIKAHAFVSLTK